MIDAVGATDDPWVSSHKTIHIGPYLQHLSIKGCCQWGCGIVRATPAQGRILVLQVAADEAWEERQGPQLRMQFRQAVLRFAQNHLIATKLPGSFNVRAAVVPGSIQISSYDFGGQAFANTGNAFQAFTTQLLHQINTL